jgi:uncharacterized protein with PIN domain
VTVFLDEHERRAELERLERQIGKANDEVSAAEVEVKSCEEVLDGQSLEVGRVALREPGSMSRVALAEVTDHERSRLKQARLRYQKAFEHRTRLQERRRLLRSGKAVPAC